MAHLDVQAVVVRGRNDGVSTKQVEPSHWEGRSTGGLGFAPSRQRAAGTTNVAQPCALVLWGKPKNRAMPRGIERKRKNRFGVKAERGKNHLAAGDNHRTDVHK